MKKILVIITTDFVPYGGLTTVMMNYYRKLDIGTFEIDFASTNEVVDAKLIEELNVHRSHYYYLGDRKKNTFRYLLSLHFLLKINHYDIIHINSNSATASMELVIAAEIGVKRRIVHNHTSRCNHKYIHKILYPLFKYLYTDAIACSQKAGDWIFKDRKYIILNNGIDTNRFKFNYEYRTKIRMIYGISDDCILLGHLGKIYSPKNHSFLVKVFSELKKKKDNYKLMLIGDGEMRHQIERLVKSLGLEQSVIFTGMQSAVEQYLSAFDIFLFPSIWEGMPLSVIEAQAAGLSCIISNSIDPAVCVTNTVTMLPIDDCDKWVHEIDTKQGNDRLKSSMKNVEMIKENGFDASLNVVKLEKIYLAE